MSENLIKQQLDEALREIDELKLKLRSEQLMVGISSEYTNFGLWEYDIASDTCYQYRKLYGWHQDDLKPIENFSKSVVAINSIYGEDLAEFKSFCESLASGDEEIFCEVRAVNDFGEHIVMRYEGKTLFDESGKPQKVIGRTIDITRDAGGSRTSNGRRDSVTGLLTFEPFCDVVGQKQSGENRFLSAAIVAVKPDGMAAGDDCVDIRKSIARSLMEITDGGFDRSIADLRNGEFLVFVRFGSIPELKSLAARILKVLTEGAVGDAGMRASAGIAVFRSDRTIKEVCALAKTARRMAEKEGGGLLFYSDTMVSTSTMSEGDPLGVAADQKRDAKIFQSIMNALIDRENCSQYMDVAISGTAVLSGADCVFFYDKKPDGVVKYVVYKKNKDVEDDKLPNIRVLCPEEELASHLGDGRLSLTEDTPCDAFELVNGAKRAEIRAIFNRGQVTAYFYFVYTENSPRESDLRIINAIHDSYADIFKGYFDNLNIRRKDAIKTVAINSVKMECFTIKPEEYVVEFVGENMAAYRGLKVGDICYKKLHGRNSPCHDCPARKLDEGEFEASLASYDKSLRRWNNVTASIALNGLGNKRYVITLTDITDSLGKIRATDTLTGVMAFDVFSAEAMNLAAETMSEYYVVIFSIGNFRRLNDEKGFEFGNSILVFTADILLKSLGRGELLCRWEGSRFVALLRSPNEEKLNNRMNQLVTSIHRQISDKFERQIYVLAGVCGLGGERYGIMGALDRAFLALKTVKDKTLCRENAVVTYTGELRENVRERRYIEENMVAALENDEFKVYYQPKVNISTGKVVGAEALVRWIRPNDEVISPGRFVPIFEENGFITDMDFAVYKKSIADVKRWIDEGYDVPLVSLNISRRHLRDENFCAKLKALVDEAGVPAERIEVEITESLLTDNIEKLGEMMVQMKEYGFKISIDDFGSGYSSLNMIALLPFDTLKIDGGFFLRNDLTDKNKKVISSVVTLAKSLNLETVSEGVETQTQVDFLRDLGCDMIQGFFYYKPMPSSEFESLISGK